MNENVGIFREEKGLKEALDNVLELKERYNDIKVESSGRKANFDLMWAMQLRGSIDIAETVVRGSLNREESRGAQFRTDFPKRDDKRFLKHTLADWNGKTCDLSWSEVDISLFEPKERKY